VKLTKQDFIIKLKKLNLTQKSFVDITGLKDVSRAYKDLDNLPNHFDLGLKYIYLLNDLEDKNKELDCLLEKNKQLEEQNSLLKQTIASLTQK
jgi:hypothetical protein